MSPFAITYWGIPAYVVFWVLTVAAVGLFAGRAYFLFRLLSLGKPAGEFDSVPKRILIAAVNVFGQWGQFKNLSIKDRSSVGHAFLFFGFLLFAPFYLIFIIIGGGFGLSETLENTRFFFYYAWVLDIVAPFVIIGALWGIIRRYIVKPVRLEGEQNFAAMLILVTVLIHPITHLFKEATSIALGHPPAGLGAVLPPVSGALSNLFSGSSAASVEAAGIAFFWVHWGFVLFVMVLIAYSRYLHMIAGPFNTLLRSLRPKGALSPIYLETAETFGAARITDFTRKQLLDCYACVVCGQCQDVCPAYASGKPLNPKKVVQDLKKHLLKAGPALLKLEDKAEVSAATANAMLVNNVITEDEIWACTTCRACQEVCPVSNEQMEKIVDLRRNLVLEQATIPETVERALRSITDRGHPWRGTTLSRTDWAQGLDIKTLADDSDFDILYWVGCTSALEERSTKIAQSVARLLQLAGVNFAILGAEESCCGEPTRRLGNEYLFQMQVKKNSELMQGYGVKKIVTACAHCYNAIKNEYPQFGGDFEVVHHTEFLADLLEEGRLRIIKGKGGVVTYHDPCYLGRYSNIYQPPRQILNNIPDITPVEMEQNRKHSFCCGGNAHTWLEERIGMRVSEIRLKQILKTEAQTVATACPFCLLMIEDAIKAKAAEESVKVMDIAELIAESAVYRPYPG